MGPLLGGFFVKSWGRLTSLRSRDLGVGALMAIVAAVLLGTTAPVAGFNGFCVGMLSGLALGIGVFAIGAYSRSRMRG